MAELALLLPTLQPVAPLTNVGSVAGRRLALQSQIDLNEVADAPIVKCRRISVVSERVVDPLPDNALVVRNGAIGPAQGTPLAQVIVEQLMPAMWTVHDGARYPTY